MIYQRPGFTAARDAELLLRTPTTTRRIRSALYGTSRRDRYAAAASAGCVAFTGVALVVVAAVFGG